MTNFLSMPMIRPVNRVRPRYIQSNQLVQAPKVSSATPPLIAGPSVTLATVLPPAPVNKVSPPVNKVSPPVNKVSPPVTITQVQPKIIPTVAELPKIITAVPLAKNKQNYIAVKLGGLLLLAFGIIYAEKSNEVDHYKKLAVDSHTVMETLKSKLTAIKASPNIVALRDVDPNEAKCMAENIYFEAGNQSLIGKIAVGQVVLNRMKSANYPKTACGVIYQRNNNTCMFSWTCEELKEINSGANWKQSQKVAYDLLSKDSPDITEGSTHFHGVNINPNWHNLKPTTKIDGHQFYR